MTFPFPPSSQAQSQASQFANLNAVRYANGFAGANAGEKIAACLADLPSAGGTCDARGLEGPQTLGSLSISLSHTRLRLGGGTYTGSIAVSASDVEILGLGDATILTVGSASNLITTADSTTDISIEGIYFQGQATVGTTAQIAVWFGTNSQRNRLVHCRFGGTSGSTGLNVGTLLDNGSMYSTVAHNYFGKTIGDTNIKGYSILLEGSSYNHIVDNTSVYDTANGRHHIYLSQECSYNLVARNILYGGRATQIKLYAVDTDGLNQYNRIEDNILVGMRAGSGTLQAGILVQQKAAHNTLARNTIIDAEPTGIYLLGSTTGGESTVDSNEVVDNHVISAHEVGIYLKAANSNRLRGNWIEGAGSATASAAFTVTGSTNTANNNTFDGDIVTGTTHTYALLIQGTSPVATGTQIAGVRFAAGTTGTILDGGSGTVYGLNYLGTSWQIGSALGVGKAPGTNAQLDVAKAIVSGVNTITFSVTPTFDAALGNTQKITLTGNVASSTLSNATSGQTLHFVICQDGTGSRTFVWPTNVKGAMTIGATLSTCSAQSFIFDGTNAYATGTGVTGQ